MKSHFTFVLVSEGKLGGFDTYREGYERTTQLNVQPRLLVLAVNQTLISIQLASSSSDAEIKCLFPTSLATYGTFSSGKIVMRCPSVSVLIL